ncbi:MAG: hypothetical protein KDB53_09600 [Planctomycetes bacterium]|nr:hypothetical protein [Planctomycetota bacterium]
MSLGFRLTVMGAIAVSFLVPLSAQDEKSAAQTGGGLHGYIGYRGSKPPKDGEFGAGIGFYAAVWRLVREPISGFQIGLPSTWITPDNSDNRDRPLAPVGTRARDNWPERGPTFSSVFQTVEGGLGYWRGNRFRYGPPKFSMNATPQCYDYEVGSPGWSFFYDTEALRDDRLGIAQLSNRLLIPPDALPFAGDPQGEILGYAYMALPFTDPVPGKPPTGDRSWTCFLNAANFKGPIAYYIPETWSKIGQVFDYEFIHGRGLDSRAGIAGGGAMEINTVPRIEARDAKGVTYSKIPALHFPVDEDGKSRLLMDVTHFSKAALFESFQSWRKGGDPSPGRFDARGSWRATLSPNPLRFVQAGQKVQGVEGVFETMVEDGNVWGLDWKKNDICPPGRFPQYFKRVGDERIAIAESEVPEETGLRERSFRLASSGDPFTSPGKGAWANPGPASGPLTRKLVDGSLVTYRWYRFVDQPSFQQYAWTEEKRDALQSFVEKIHEHWKIDGEYMAPPTRGSLVRLDPALLVTPPKGMERGYVPIVTRQEAAR